jgi:replication factor C small subunit
MPISDEIRPNILNDVLGQDHIVKRLNQMVESNNFNWPHMMFAGPAGVGKTSTAIALMRTAFGESWKENWLELNARVCESRCNRQLHC